MLYQLSYTSDSSCTPAEARPFLPRGGLKPAATTISVVVQAGDGTRTRDIKLGRLALYQLSYSRNNSFKFLNGGGRIRTFEGVSRQIYSLLPLAAWVPHRVLRDHRPFAFSRRADDRNRTGNLSITNRLLRQLSYVSWAFPRKPGKIPCIMPRSQRLL